MSSKVVLKTRSAKKIAHRKKKKRRCNQPAEATQRGTGHRINQRPKVSKIQSNREFKNVQKRGDTGGRVWKNKTYRGRHSGGDGERKRHFLFFPPFSS